jgi:predicted branched-subunit amino acid permease
MTRRDAWILRAFAAWTVWVWFTRIGNVIGDDGRSFGFKAVHVALALVSAAFAVVTWRIAARSRSRDRSDSLS